jgi:hypothetical protein
VSKPYLPKQLIDNNIKLQQVITHTSYFWVAKGSKQGGSHPEQAYLSCSTQLASKYPNKHMK